ncbi:MAG: beta-lactamase family protein, partial [Blastocatellia bacterium]|nr:beta-lactamase family protein [Blastocatellia bacterium]
DVNDYLDFNIVPTYPQPITLRNLLTHTAGFEETLSELWVREGDLKPIGDYLKLHQPHRIFSPGKVPAYSNYGVTLAGYLVQRVSGEPFEDYVEKHILQPLGMDHTTFREPLPAKLEPLMSTAYKLASGAPQPWEFVQVMPAGSASASANDMAAFMIAHLQNGQYRGTQILRPETAQQMHARQFENFPALSGAAFGFFEENRNGHRIIGHTGDTMYYHSVAHLIPEAGVGLFYSQTSSGKGEVGLRALVWDQFLDRYFPASQSVPAAIAGNAADGNLVAGSYISSRRADTTVTKVLTLLSELKIVANNDGTISLTVLKDLNGQPKKYRETAPLFFRSDDGRSSIAFRREADGAITAATDFPFETFHKASWYENNGLHLWLIFASVTIFIVALILWPVAALTRRHFGQKLEIGLKQRRLRLCVRIVSLLNLGFLLAFSLTCIAAASDIALLSPRLNPWLHILQVIGWVGILGLAVAALNAVSAWKNRGRLVAIGETSCFSRAPISPGS